MCAFVLLSAPPLCFLLFLLVWGGQALVSVKLLEIIMIATDTIKNNGNAINSVIFD